MLLFSLIFNILFTFFNFKLEILSEKQASQRENYINVACYISFALYYILYCTAHWIFAMKYWIISYRLGQGKMLALMNFFYNLVIVLNVAIPIYSAVEQGRNMQSWRVSY